MVKLILEFYRIFLDFKNGENVGFWNLASNENAKLNFRPLNSLSRTQVRLVKHSFFSEKQGLA